jgi:hypothetical protein
VCQLLEDDHRSREQPALAIDFGADVLTNRGPPDIASRDKGRRLDALMQLLFETDPLENNSRRQ